MDENMLKALMKKGKKREMSDDERDAKLSVLKDLRDQAAGDMSEKMRGLKKVTVAASDKEGLKKGLEKAEEIVEGSEAFKQDPFRRQKDAEELMEDEPEMSPESEAKAEDDESYEDCSPEELDAKIEKLKALKLKKQASY